MRVCGPSRPLATVPKVTQSALEGSQSAGPGPEIKRQREKEGREGGKEGRDGEREKETGISLFHLAAQLFFPLFCNRQTKCACHCGAQQEKSPGTCTRRWRRGGVKGHGSFPPPRLFVVSAVFPAERVGLHLLRRRHPANRLTGYLWLWINRYCKKNKLNKPSAIRHVTGCVSAHWRR